MLRPSPAAGRSEAPLPPPAYIKLPQGAITSAARAEGNPHAGKRTTRSGAQKAGLAYQKRVIEFLVRTCACSSLASGPWYFYSDASGRRSYCQPDALAFDIQGVFESVAVVEIKLRWTVDAWYQLRQLYIPVLSAALPGKTFLPVVICRSYDPAIRIGEPVHLIDGLEEAQADKFNVLIWRS